MIPDDFDDDMAFKNLVRVIRRPRMDEMNMIPTRMKEMCYDKKMTSNSRPSLLLAISKPRVIGSVRPTCSNRMLMMHMKILYRQ